MQTYPCWRQEFSLFHFCFLYESADPLYGDLDFYLEQPVFIASLLALSATDLGHPHPIQNVS